MRHDLTDLRLFVNVGETQNLTRAAERTFLSLPAASARIKNMEEGFKARLLVRLATGVSLTPAGEVLLHHARAIFSQLECLNADLQPYTRGVKGRLRLLANTTATNSFLADALSTFLPEHPDVDIELTEKSSVDIVLALRAGAGDLGIVSGTISSDGLDVYPLFRDELAVVTSLTHPLASEPRVQFADLLEHYQFVGIHPDSAIQTFLEDIASGLGKRVNQRVHVGSFEAVCRMVEAGAGIAIVPRACAARYSRPQALKVVPLADEWALRDRLLCRQRGRDLPRFAEDFIQHIMRATQADPSPR
jgi:DNA-binding transcriptional LysR family regulator